MTEHLPECPVEKMLRSGRTVGSQSCICEHLRACEQRMLDDGLPAAANHGQRGYEIGYAAALDAAREAVKHLQHSDDCYYEEGVLCHCEIKRAITAIDALHDEPCEACNGTGHVKCWSPGGPCPAGQKNCECCGPCRQCDSLAAIDALRKGNND